jgi:hypothetical protein
MITTGAGSESSPTEWTEEQWLVMFQEWEQLGYYQQVPRIREMLAHLDVTLERAQLSTEPPFHPPDDFAPYLGEVGRGREWRTQWRFPDLHHLMVEMLQLSIEALEAQECQVC